MWSYSAYWYQNDLQTKVGNVEVILRWSINTTTSYSEKKKKKNWQMWAELEESSTMPNFHLCAVYFVMDSIILHIILKVNKLNLFHSISY